MANKIQLRRDSAANWAAFNPVLADGEIGIDTTNGYMKFGDGVSPWNECMYVRFPGVGPDNLSITGTPPSGTVGQAYSFVPTITGGVGAKTVASIGAALPAGTGLNTTTGAITGTLSGSAATYSGIILRVTDADGNVASLNLAAIVVAGAAQLSISGSPATTGTVGSSYSFNVTSAGGTAPRTYSVASGALPTGISLNASTGAVSGTPSSAGTSSGIVIRVTDAVGATADLAAFSINVSSGVATLTISGTPSTSATVGTAYTFTPTAAGGVTPRTFALIAGTLPAGLSFSTSTGAITGTPTTTGTATGLSIRVTDNVGTQATLATFSIAVAAPVADSRARFGYGSATAGVTGPEALLASMTVFGSANASKTGAFTSAPPSGQYVWAAFEADASAAGVTFTVALGPGGWQGASSSGPNFDDPGSSPNTSTVTAVINGVTWRFFRTSFANAADAWTTS